MPVVASKSDDAAFNSVENETADAAASAKVSTPARAKSHGGGFVLDAKETADASALAKVSTTARAHIFALAYPIISHAQPLVYLHDGIYVCLVKDVYTFMKAYIDAYVPAHTHAHMLACGPMIFTRAQCQSSPARESTRGDILSAGVAGCAICGKTPEETQFTKSQKKRLRKGKTARCELCTAAKKSENVIASEIVHTNKTYCNSLFFYSHF